jgi:hypothetical protein
MNNIIDLLGDTDQGVIAFKIENGIFKIIPGILSDQPVTIGESDFDKVASLNDDKCAYNHGPKRDFPIVSKDLGPDYNMYKNPKGQPIEANLKVEEMKDFMPDLYDYYRCQKEAEEEKKRQADAISKEALRIANEKAQKEADDKAVAKLAIQQAELEKQAQELERQKAEELEKQAELARVAEEEKRIAEEELVIKQTEEKRQQDENLKLMEKEEIRDKIFSFLNNFIIISETEIRDVIFTFTTTPIYTDLITSINQMTAKFDTEKANFLDFKKIVMRFINNYNAYRAVFIEFESFINDLFDDILSLHKDFLFKNLKFEIVKPNIKPEDDFSEWQTSSANAQYHRIMVSKSVTIEEAKGYIKIRLSEIQDIDELKRINQSFMQLLNESLNKIKSKIKSKLPMFMKNSELKLKGYTGDKTARELFETLVYCQHNIYNEKFIVDTNNDPLFKKDKKKIYSITQDNDEKKIIIRDKNGVEKINKDIDVPKDGKPDLFLWIFLGNMVNYLNSFNGPLKDIAPAAPTDSSKTDKSQRPDKQEAKPLPNYIFSFEFRGKKYFVIYILSHGEIRYKGYKKYKKNKNETVDEEAKLIDFNQYPNINRVIKISKSRPGEETKNSRSSLEHIDFKESLMKFIGSNTDYDLTSEDVLQIFLTDEQNNLTKAKQYRSAREIIDPTKTHTTKNEYTKGFIGPQRGFYEKVFTVNHIKDSIYIKHFFEELKKLGFTIGKTRTGDEYIYFSHIFKYINDQQNLPPAERKIDSDNVIIIDKSCNISELKLYESFNAVNGGDARRFTQKNNNDSKRKTLKIFRSF